MNSTLQHKDKIISILGKEKVFAREDGQMDIGTLILMEQTEPKFINLIMIC